MKTLPEARPVPAEPVPTPVQAHLQLNAPKADRHIPEANRSECVGLLRELIETVAGGSPSPEEGGAND